MKRLLSLLMAVLIVMSVCGCHYQHLSDDEDTEQQTLTIDNPDFYQKFKGKGISINVYNWGEYISDGSDGLLDVNTEFTNLTGINVNYSTYANNEELYAKLKGGGADYDIIIPSDYMIARMIKEGMVQKLNFENIPNYQYIMDSFKGKLYDPKNEYSVPYTWGTVGIIYDNSAIDVPPEEIDWDILWDEKYRDSILMFDNPRDAFAIAEKLLGYSMNTEDPKELKNAAEKLKEQKHLVQSYVMDEVFDKMGAGEAVLAPYYAGDAVTLMDEYDHLSFAIPKSGTNLFFDAICIPTGARQKEAAELYINFMCEPDVAYATTSYIGYSTPNGAAYEMLDDEVKEDGISYLDDEFLDDKTEVFANMSDEANLMMQNLWTDMKSTQEDSGNKWLVPLFLLACVLLSVAIIIKRYLKNKKDIF
ncbi:MAG: ABC transporter substrate-binding protein [Clostridiales bacterium]|nr:ABC transporter substrate-binding protein [Clostridiales bacterium]